MMNITFPPFVHWEVTPECNHNCIHCYNYWRKEEEKLALNKSEFNEDYYMRIAKILYERKVHQVVVTGGEPLLVFKQIKKAIVYLRENNIHVSINTNAVLINDEIIEFILKYKLTLFISFPCSKPDICNFITDTNGSFNRVITSLNKLQTSKVPFSLNIVASKANLNYISETVDFLKENFNISKIFITRVGKPINSSSEFDKYLLSKEDICKLQDISVETQYEKNIKVDTGCPYTLCSINSQEAFELFAYNKICTAGKTSFALDTFGNVKACPRDSTYYGNILTDPFDDIWNNMSCWRDGSLLPKECEKCSLSNICKGGCRVDSLPFTNCLNTLDTTAFIENLPIKYLRKSLELKDYSNQIFTVNPLYKVPENFGFRVSSTKGRGYVFITDELLHFLEDNKFISVENITKVFSVNETTANNILSRLFKNGIISCNGGELNG